MRIIQIIDSLNAGGAEKMAVNYANVLADEIEFSGLVATRKEGDLKNMLLPNVDYLFLNKTTIFDIAAILRLKKYCKLNNIDVVQAHSSSYFLACIVKIILPSIKIIWHDHNGGVVPKREGQFYIQVLSVFFSGIISVNQELKNWALKKLLCRKVIYLSNFSVHDNSEIKSTVLHGSPSKRVLCLANLRFQKNHQMLLQLASKLKKSYPDWTIHIVGKDFDDHYSANIRKIVDDNYLQDNVFFYGSRKDINNIIAQATICVFTSISEGLPVSLLEYGLLKKPVLSTRVGEIQYIINNGKNGLLVDSNDVESFYENLLLLINSQSTRDELGQQLFETVNKNHSQTAVIKQYLKFIATI